MDGREDLSRIAGVLRDLQPDIAGLQEVDNRYADRFNPPQLQFLAEETGLTPLAGPTMVRADGDYGNALLTRLPVREVRSIDLSYPGREPRGGLDVDLQVSGGRLRVIATHLGLRPAERRFQVKRLMAAVETEPPAPLLLMGDLNEWFLFGRPLRWLRRHFGRTSAPATFPAFFPLLALDRIFVDPPQALAGLWRIHTREARAASDHLPLAARIRLA